MKRIKRIRSISILGVKHSVRHIKTENGDNGYYSDGLVEINKEIQNKEEYLKTLLHECLHGVLEKSGIHQDISLPQEHTIIDSTITFLLTNFDIELKKK
jgi:hypothetical protein